MATAVAVALGACGAPDDDVSDEDLEEIAELNETLDGGKADGGEWIGIGNGVAYQRQNAGTAVLIAYGGYSAKLTYSAAWATELVDARLGAVEVGHVYAVKGPAQASYAGREIGNSKLRAHLATLGSDAPIYVVAHSSGAFVAHELLSQLHANSDSATLGRIHYANLDGGGSGFTSAIAAQLAHLSFVYAKDPTLARGLSQNSGAAIALGVTYADWGAAFMVSVPNTGCNSGAGWCLHDVVITHRPHDPAMYNLELDYTDFVDRPVTTEYFDPILE